MKRNLWFWYSFISLPVYIPCLLDGRVRLATLELSCLLLKQSVLSGTLCIIKDVHLACLEVCIHPKRCRVTLHPALQLLNRSLHQTVHSYTHTAREWVSESRWRYSRNCSAWITRSCREIPSDLNHFLKTLLLLLLTGKKTDIYRKLIIFIAKVVYRCCKSICIR